jgi:hypothetical protein
MANKFIASGYKTISIIAFGLLTASAFPANAKTADPSLYFYPAKGWQVGTAGKTIGLDGASPACFIRNQFNNGYIIQFSGDQSTIDTVNIDFRQDVFTPGKNYPATVSIPGGTRQEVIATASNARTLSAPLPLGAASVETLRKTSAMDFFVEGNAFRFYLTGFASSVPSYKNCAQPEVANTIVPEKLKIADQKPLAILNESIAMEEKETKKADSNPMPLAKAPPPADISTINDIKKDLPIIDTTVKNDPVIQPIHVEEKVIVRNQAKIEGKNSSLFSTDRGRKRMSETLAQEIQQNPAILGEDAPGNIQKRPGLSVMQDSKVQAEPVKPIIINAVDPQISPVKNEDPKIAMQMPEPTISDSKPVISQREDIFPELPRPAMEKPDTKKIETAKIEAAAEASIVPKAPAQDLVEIPMKNVQEAQNLKSPPLKINKTVQKFEIDLTENDNLQNIEPAAGANEMPDMTFEAQRQDIPTRDAKPAPRKADPEMIQKISDLEAAIAKMKKENDALNADLKAAMREGKKEIASIAGDNWDLEKATLAYNEADRQLKRLGRQLQQARSQCDAEKQDIEAQLFDPQIASQQQQARLFELEQKLAEAEQKLENQRALYESRIKIPQDTRPQ